LEPKARNITLAVKIEDDYSAVRVDLTEAWTPFFAHFVSDQVTPIRVTSKARFIGHNNICVLGLANKNAGVTLGQDARLTGR
jgi:hypothetical protein